MTKPPKEPLTDWQKFALLIFGLVVLVGVALVYIYIRAGIEAM